VLNIDFFNICCKHCNILPDNFIDIYNNKINLFIYFLIIIDLLYDTILFILFIFIVFFTINMSK
jgi:hypothetical protein